MKDTLFKSYRAPFLCSMMLHLALFLFIFTQPTDKASSLLKSSASSQLTPPALLPSAPIKATSVNSDAVEKEIAKIRQKEQAEEAHKRQEQLKFQQTQVKARQAQEEYKKIQAAKQKLQKEIKKNKALAEQQKKQAIAEQKKAETAKLELAALKKKQAVETAALKKKQLEAAELKKKQVEQKEAVKQDNEEENSKKRLEEEALLSEEGLETTQKPSQKKNSQNLASDSLSDEELSEIDRYKQLILKSIEQHWVIPNDVDRSLSCQLRVRLAAGGTVLSVNLIKSSGNALLDQSAQTAVMKASPLPVPTNAKLFDTFRELSLTVRPEDF